MSNPNEQIEAKFIFFSLSQNRGLELVQGLSEELDILDRKSELLLIRTKIPLSLNYSGEQTNGNWRKRISL